MTSGPLEGSSEDGRPGPAERDSPVALFLRFLKLGALAWGGPAPQIAMIKHECVDEEGWVDEEAFRRTLAVYQVLPGPEAHELCVYMGRLRGGALGGIAAGLGFMLPGFVLMLALTIVYVEAEASEALSELFYGLAAAVGAIVARALLRLRSTFVTDLPLAAIAVAAFALMAFSPVSFLIILGGGGIAYELWTSAGRHAAHVRSLSPFPLALVLLAGAASLPLLSEILLAGLQAGLLTFGGAFTVIPVLQEIAVTRQGWLTESEFVDGLAIGGVLPAPLVIFSTFVGYLAGGVGGALVITFGVFLPAFLLPILLHRRLVSLADNPRVRPFLLGVAAAVVGLIAAVGVRIVEVGVVDAPSAALALAAFAALLAFHSKLTVLWVVLACGATGAALQLTVL